MTQQTTSFVSFSSTNAAATSAPTELSFAELKLVGGGTPKGGWGPAQASTSSVPSTEPGTPKGRLVSHPNPLLSSPA